jgi:hypothetical protein
MMVTDRLMEGLEDELNLAMSLTLDEHHHDTPVAFFKQEGTMTKVYEEDSSPIFYARAAKSLRLDIHFVDNGDKERNAKALLQGFAPLCAQAKANGFSEIIFTTNVPELRDFCERAFGYEQVPDKFVLRKLL